MAESNEQSIEPIPSVRLPPAARPLDCTEVPALHAEAHKLTA